MATDDVRPSIQPGGRVPECAVCVVTFNSAHTIGALLRSLSAEEFPVRARVQDNYSSDSTVQVLQDLQSELDLELEVEASPTNVGFPAACNALLGKSSEPVVALINPDIELTPGALASLVELVTADDSVGIATCRLAKRDDGQAELGMARKRPRLRRLILPRPVRWRLERRHEDRLFVDQDVECMAGAMMVFRRSLLDEIGYLDESVFMYLEDVDFAARVLRAGYRIRYVSTVWAWHDGGASTPEPDEPRLYRQFPRVWITYVSRYGSPWERIAVRPVVLARTLGKAIVRVAKGKSPAGQFAGAWDALTYRPQPMPVWKAGPHSAWTTNETRPGQVELASEAHE